MLPQLMSASEQGILWSELQSMFSQPGMPPPFDTHLPQPVQLPVLPCSCQLVGRQPVGVERGAGAAGQPSAFVPGTALPRTQRAE